MVFKLAQGKYYPGKRPVGVTVKAKTEKTFDAIVTGFILPTVEYTGTELDSWPYWVENDGHYTRIQPEQKNFVINKIPVTKAYYYN